MAETMVATGAFFFLWVFVGWIACGVFAAYVAAQKNRCVPCWFVWGVLFGPIALLTIVGVPVRLKQSQGPIIGHDGKVMQ